jgi:hypothetical protein
MTEKILGIVKEGLFRRLTPIRDWSGCRLTRIAPQAGQSPESAEIELAKYEGSAVMVTGDPQEFWIYSADVIEEAGPIVSVLVEHVLGGVEKEIEAKEYGEPT